MKDISIHAIDPYTIEIRNEGHTLLNPLRWIIGNNWEGDDVEFVGYNIPHPSEEKALFTVQFSDEKDQNIKKCFEKIKEGTDILAECCDKIQSELKIYSELEDSSDYK